MSASKYNWAQLELDFMQSSFLNVLPWTRHTSLPCPSPNSPTFKKRTRGWAKVKEERENEKAKKILEQAEKKEVMGVVQALEKMKNALVRRVNISDELNVNDLNKLWGMLRIENGLPITIAKNENKNEDLTREKELEVLKALTEKVKANVSNNTNPNSNTRSGNL